MSQYPLLLLAAILNKKPPLGHRWPNLGSLSFGWQAFIGPALAVFNFVHENTTREDKNFCSFNLPLYIKVFLRVYSGGGPIHARVPIHAHP